MIGRISAGLAALVFMAFTATAAQAQNINVDGKWRCVVNATSNNDPSGNYTVEMDVIIQGNYMEGEGTVIYHGLANPIKYVAGFGDLTLMPPDVPGGNPLIKFRLHPTTGNHAIITWFAFPTAPGTMYNRFNPPMSQTGGRHVDVETSCGKFG